MMKSEIIEKEEVFHDNWADCIDLDCVPVDQSFEACTAPENKTILNWLGDVTNKEVLEIGCGAGEASIYFAKKGANVTASDISSQMLDVVKTLAQKENVCVKTAKCTSTEICAEDNSFDIVYAANILHHVELESTLIEVMRVLKPGGIFVSWDPLIHNPLINVYRKIASGVRTEDEHPLNIDDITVVEKYFSNVKWTTTWFFTLWIFMRFFLIERVNPNKERYWKKILYEHKRLASTYSFLEKADNFM